MGYVVIEIQVNADGSVGTLIWHHADEMQAQSKYHTILAAAAISALPRHAASLMTNDGYVLAHQSYEHDAQPEPEQEAE